MKKEELKKDLVKLDNKELLDILVMVSVELRQRQELSPFYSKVGCNSENDL